jgi:ATP-dependent protease ClpP protease subunit
VLAALRRKPTSTRSHNEKGKETGHLAPNGVACPPAGYVDLGGKPQARAHEEILCGVPPSGVKWFEIKAAAKTGEPVEILIYGMIGKNWLGEGMDAASFAAELGEKAPAKDQAIVVRINSNGGNVNDGLAVYHLLKERGQHVTTKVDGVAASSASLILMAGHRVEIPKNGLVMVHNPWTYAEGNADDLRRVAARLDVYRDSICGAYEQKTKRRKHELCELMDAETWMRGEEAKKQGFADVVTDEEISFQACADFDYSKFKHVPEHLKKTTPTKGTSAMNRQQILARLLELGVQHDPNATDEQLQALLRKAEKKATKAAARTQPPQDIEDESEADDDETEVEGEGDEGPEDAVPGPSAPAGAPRNRNRSRRQPRASADPNAARISALEADNALIKSRYEGERKRRIELAVDACVDADQIPATQRDKWVARALTNEDVLDDLRALPARPPGVEPLGIVITSDAPKDIERGVLNMRAPVVSWLKGNSVDPKVISQSSIAIARAIEQNRKKLDGILAANTVDPNLKRNVIMSDLMRAFKRKLLSLNAFTLRFTNIPLEGTNKITMPFYELDTASATDFNSALGYVFTEDTTNSSRELTINKRKYKTMDFSSETFRRQPYFNADLSMQLKVEQLGVTIWQDVLSIITASNYGNSVYDQEASQFDTDDVILIDKILNDLDWPDSGRALVLGTAHKAALLSDDALKHMMNSGSTEPLRSGSTGRIINFDLFYSPRIPTNSEDLAGFACLPQAVLVGTAPIAPAPGVRQQLLAYDLVVDPDTGLAFEYRYGADTWMDKDREVVECNYGYAKGNNYCLKRIGAGAAEFSSSSSLSSVNSSSSSSSSPSF